MAHRGGALSPQNLQIENTVAAFAHAVSLGYRYLETDVRTSRDGVVHVFHDEDLSRVAGRRGSVDDLTAAELREVLIGGQEPLPLLADVLREFAGICFNIDVKTDAALEPTLEVIDRAGAWDRVCLASFSHARLRRIRRLAPRAATAASPQEIAALRLGPRLGGRGTLARSGAHCLQVPLRQGPVPVVTRRFVRHAHSQGLAVHVWTVDDPDLMEELLRVGVDGLMTDRPEVLREVLISRGEWPA